MQNPNLSKNILSTLLLAGVLALAGTACSPTAGEKPAATTDGSPWSVGENAETACKNIVSAAECVPANAFESAVIDTPDAYAIQKKSDAAFIIRTTQRTSDWKHNSATICIAGCAGIGDGKLIDAAQREKAMAVIFAFAQRHFPFPEIETRDGLHPAKTWATFANVSQKDTSYPRDGAWILKTFSSKPNGTKPDRETALTGKFHVETFDDRTFLVRKVTIGDFSEAQGFLLSKTR